MNVDTQSSPSSSQPAGGSGPIVAIAIGLVIIVGAVVLVMNVGEKPIENANTSAPVPTPPGTEATPPGINPGATPPETPAANSSSAEGEKEVELPVELPNPAFAGTPKEAPKNTRMVPLTGKEREAFYAPPGLTNVAAGKTATSSDARPLFGTLDQITDEDKEPLDGRWVELAPGVQWAQVDLGKPYEIFVVMVWHNHLELKVYRDVIVRVSDDPEFKTFTEVYNNDYDNTSKLGEGKNFEYFENYEGLLVDVRKGNEGKPATARYVRCYSNGSTDNDANHYAEIEVWAREKK